MDRNPNESFSTPGGSAGGTGSASDFDTTGPAYGTAGATTGAGSSDTAYADASRTESRKFSEKASEKLGHAKETATEKLDQARHKANELKHTLADRLDSQAERLRSRSMTATGSYATAEGVSAISTPDTSTSRVGDRVASGMHSTADWLRQNDLDSMKRGVEEQVRTNPGRALLVAAVAGYLIGKAFRR